MNRRHHTSTPPSGFGLLRAPVLATALLASAFVAGSGAASAQGSAPLDINTATAEQLSTLIRGVGMKRAEAIVTYRESNGPFASVDDLTLVSGVGPNTVEANRERLTVGDQPDGSVSN